MGLILMCWLEKMALESDLQLSSSSCLYQDL